jgi:hypothetical protein
VRHILALADKANGCLYANLRPTLAQQAPGGGVAAGGVQLPLPPEFVYGAAHRAADDDLWQSHQVRCLPVAVTLRLSPWVVHGVGGRGGACGRWRCLAPGL